MNAKVFVVSLDNIEDKGIPTKVLYTMPIEDLEQISAEVITPEKAIGHLNFPEISCYDVEDHLFVYREVPDNKNEIHITLGQDDWQEVIVNKELQIHVSMNEGGYIVDKYVYRENTPLDEDDRDLDNDLLSGDFVRFEDIDNCKNS